MNKRALKAYVFFCSNNLEPRQLSVLAHENKDDSIKTVSLPCSGKVDIPYLIKAFETGADGVAIVTCKKNECRHFEGNLRAQKRADGVETLLEEIGLAKGRMAVFECDKQDPGAVLGDIKRFMEQVRDLPSAPAASPQANQPQSTRP
jgi:coenzyme F420-reducing hydrogenase delta subunit